MKIIGKIVLALAVIGTLFGVGAGLAMASPAGAVTHTYWQQDDGVGAVVTTTAPNNAAITVDGNPFAASTPGPNSFAAYLQAGAGQWIYGPDKAYVPAGYGDPAVPSTTHLTKVWSGKVDGYATTLWTNAHNPNSAASILSAWLAS